MNAPVFLDSGIFIAFLNKSDRWHSHKIQTVWSTDHHLAVTGARVVPFAE